MFRKPEYPHSLRRHRRHGHVRHRRGAPRTMGYRVSGSDMNDSRIYAAPPEHRLRSSKQGLVRNIVEAADVVVVSSAIKGYNPEVEACSRGARFRSFRAPNVGRAMRMKIGDRWVAGAHGKTTSTTMMHTVMMAAGARPDRGDSAPRQLARPPRTRAWGKSDYLVAGSRRERWLVLSHSRRRWRS